MRFIILIVALLLNLIIPISIQAGTVPSISQSKQLFDYDSALAFSQAALNNQVSNLSLPTPKVNQWV